MKKQERLKKEVRELLTGGKSSLTLHKQVFYDEKAKQFSIKIPKDIALGAALIPGSEVKIVLNPGEKEFEDIKKTHFIIYGKEKEKSTK